MPPFDVGGCARASCSVMTAAAVSAPAAAHIFIGRHAAELQGFVDVLMNRLLHVVYFLLSVEESAGDWIVEDGFPLFFEFVDFVAGKWDRAVFFFVQRLTFGDETFVLSTRFFVPHKGVDSLANGAHIWLVEDGLAEFFGFLEDRSFFDGRLHIS